LLPGFQEEPSTIQLVEKQYNSKEEGIKNIERLTELKISKGYQPLEIKHKQSIDSTHRHKEYEKVMEIE